MKSRLALTIFVGFILVLAGTNLIRVSSSRSKAQQLRELDNAEDKNSVGWRVRVAKVKGDKQAVLPTGNIDYADGVRTVDEALIHNEAIIASPIKEKSEVVDDDSIQTWYKVRVLENLSDKNVLRCADCVPSTLVVPQELLPLNKDEILILQSGGSVVVDSVQVVMSDPAFPKLELGGRYLLFLQTDQSRRIGFLMMGPTGVYTMDNDDKLTPINIKPHPFKSEMSDRYNSSIESIRGHVRSKTN